MGGVHASLLPQEALRYAGRVVVGEAEEVIADVVEGRARPGIIHGRPVEELDSLPYPDFSLLEGYRSPAQLAPISTSRGCPFDCSFCSVTKMFGRKYRFRSCENVIKELASRKEKSYFFCDDNFTAQPKRSQKLLSALLKQKIGEWTCQVRCDAARDAGMLRLMARSGCKSVCVGFESVNRRTLQAFDKKQTLEEIAHAIRSFHREKISIHGMFVVGGDDDGREAARDTVKFAIRHKIDTMQMMILTPFPGTRVQQDLERQGRVFNRDWDLYDGQHAVFKPKLLSAKELQLSTIKAYEKFYSFFNAFSLLAKLKFRNAFFRFMGRSVLKEWKRHNHNLGWLAKAAVS
jgi:radical SAM superfamily enzyme YgiQ (UPF0313 family)